MTQTSQNKKMPQVALLMGDRVEARRLAQVFRKMGILPCVYDSLVEFGRSLFKDRPDLSIVDIVKMREGDYLLKNHPLVKDESLFLSFYYREDNAHLLGTIDEFFNLGTICREREYEGQLKSILKRVNRYLKYQYMEDDLKKRVVRMQKRSAKLTSSLEYIKLKERNETMAYELIHKIEESHSELHFGYAIQRAMAAWDDIEAFGIYELSQNGQKLVSPKNSHFASTRFESLPSLWLGQVCKNGIESFAQTMALQVAMDLFGSTVFSIKVTGREMFPDMMVYLKPKDETIFSQFPWELFELLLNGVYGQYLLKKTLSEREREKQDLYSPWEFMSFVDEGYYGNLPGRCFLFSLDFSELLATIKEVKEAPFAWKDFARDFYLEMKKQLKGDFKASSFNVNNLSFFFEGYGHDIFLEELKRFSFQFPYWRYFDDPSLLMGRELAPSIKSVPLTPNSFLETEQESPVTKSIKQNFQSIESNETTIHQ